MAGLATFQTVPTVTIFDFSSTFDALSELDGLDWLGWVMLGVLLNPLPWFLFEVVKAVLKKRMPDREDDEDLNFYSGLIAFVALPLLLFHLSVVLGVTGGPSCQTVWESGGGAKEVCE